MQAAQVPSSSLAAYDVFVKRAINAILKEVEWGRSKEYKELREVCQHFLASQEASAASSGTPLSLGLAVLPPLQLACASSNSKVVDIALGCLHKLVAHAWLQGESSASGEGDGLIEDEADVVARVIRLVIKCGEQQASISNPNSSSSSSPLQLSIIRALLTFTTAEHFVAHGDSLMSAIRTVFNLALSSTDENIKRTACNALLQMLNTVAKRVTAFHAHVHSMEGSRRVSEQDDGRASSISRASHADGHAEAAAPAAGTAHSSNSNAQQHRPASPSTANAHASAPGWQHQKISSPALEQKAQAEGAACSLPPGENRGELVEGGAAAATAGTPGTEGSTAEEHAASSARMAQFASLAEQQDIRGLEAAIGAAPASSPTGSSQHLGMQLSLEHAQQQEASPSPSQSSSGPSTMRNGHAAPNALVPAPNSPASPTVTPTAPAPAISPQHSSSSLTTGASPSTLAAVPTIAHSQAHPASKLTQPPLPSLAQLSVAERDVLLVLTAFCKLASREAGITEMETYLHQGKLLALELLVKVLHNPQHQWDNVRTTFTQCLRQPLCITLLRNCTTSDAAAFQLAIKLLVAVMVQPKLRSSLRAELGAFYPLFVLRPLEQGSRAQQAAHQRQTEERKLQGGGEGAEGGGDVQGGVVPPPSSPPNPPTTVAVTMPGNAADAIAAEQTDLHTLYVVLSSLRQLCGEPQMVADLFVNYDCDPHAPPLFERTVQALGWLSQRTDTTDLMDRPGVLANSANGGGGSSSVAPLKAAQEAGARLVAVREQAIRCVVSLVACLDVWAGPLKEAGQQARAAGMEQQHGSNGDAASEESSSASGATGPQENGSTHGGGSEEAGRLEAVWAHKSSLNRGLAMFNHGNPIKAIRFLASQGIVEDSPQAVAAFLRGHIDSLDKAALGEYFGAHEAFEVAAMHAFIDQERYTNVPLDIALRKLLAQFRLPGEAQKIDRIMEKFAERYVKDNAATSAFRNADGAYLLSFAIIMLNTDAHNPVAEGRLAKADFVSMCHQPLGEEEGGGMAPVLPPEQLEEIYDHIVQEEIQVHELGRQQQHDRATARQAHASKASGRNRLAAALGLRALALPFPARGGANKAQEQHLTAAQRKRALLALAERAMVLQAGSGTWATASHAELARPMLTVAAGSLLVALAAALRLVGEPAAAESLLRSLVQLLVLCGVLGLDDQCKQCLDVLADLSGVFRPAPCGSLWEQRQLAALKILVALPSSPSAGVLGSGWVTLMRALSALSALCDLLLQRGVPVGASSSNPHLLSPSTHAQPNGGPRPPPPTPLNKMLQALGSSLTSTLGMQPSSLFGSNYSEEKDAALIASTNGSSSTNPSNGAPLQRSPLKQDGAKRPWPPNEPGTALVLWADGEEGRELLQQAIQASTALDGQAVVVLFRALCAVSREELELAQPRVYCLEELVACAWNNIGRIRLIWSQLWAIVSMHLVAAACHSNEYVRSYAEDMLHALAGKLLARSADLVHYRTQEDALQPFVALLRQCDEPRVREAAIAHVHHLVAHGGCAPGSFSSRPHSATFADASSPYPWSVASRCDGVRRLDMVPAAPLSPVPPSSPLGTSFTMAGQQGGATEGCCGLGSGWRTLLEVLKRGAGDTYMPVVARTMAALALPVQALFQEQQGHEAASHQYLWEVVRAIMEGVRNPLDAREKVGSPKQRLAEEVGLQGLRLLQACTHRLASHVAVHGGAGAPKQAQAAAAATLQQQQQQQQRQQGEEGQQGRDAQGQLETQEQQQQQQHDEELQLDLHGSSHRGGEHASLADAANSPEAAQSLEDPWTLLLASMSEIATQPQPSRARLATAATQAVLDYMLQYGHMWSMTAWHAFLQHVLPTLFLWSPAQFHTSNPFHAHFVLPTFHQGTTPLARPDSTIYTSSGLMQPSQQHQGQLASQRSAALYSKLTRRSQTSPPAEFVHRASLFFPMLCGRLEGAAPKQRTPLLLQLAHISLTWLQQAHEPLAILGLQSIEQLLDQLAACHDWPAWQQLLQLLVPVVHAQLEGVLQATHQLQEQRISAQQQQQESLRHLVQQQKQQQQQGGGEEGLIPQHLRLKPPPPQLQQLMPEARGRSRMLIMSLRLLARLHRTHAPQAMPWHLQAQILHPLTHCVRAAMTTNRRLAQRMSSALSTRPRGLPLGDAGFRGSVKQVLLPPDQQQQQQQPGSAQAGGGARAGSTPPLQSPFASGGAAFAAATAAAAGMAASAAPAQQAPHATAARVPGAVPLGAGVPHGFGASPHSVASAVARNHPGALAAGSQQGKDDEDVADDILDTDDQGLLPTAPLQSPFPILTAQACASSPQSSSDAGTGVGGSTQAGQVGLQGDVGSQGPQAPVQHQLQGVPEAGGGHGSSHPGPSQASQQQQQQQQQQPLLGAASTATDLQPGAAALQGSGSSALDSEQGSGMLGHHPQGISRRRAHRGAGRVHDQAAAAAAAIQYSLACGPGGGSGCLGQVRLESEAMVLALDALELCVQLASSQHQQQLGFQGVEGGGAAAEGDVAPALSMLHELCTFVITHCAESLQGPPTAAQSSSSSSSAKQPAPASYPAAAAPPQAAAPADMEDDDLSVVVVASASSASTTNAWLECVRAPLLVRTLRTYTLLPQARQVQEVQSMWTPLLRLACSTQERVRAAVALHLEQAVQPILMHALSLASPSAASSSTSGAGPALI